jgi:hypothetical protein
MLRKVRTLSSGLVCCVACERAEGALDCSCCALCNVSMDRSIRGNVEVMWCGSRQRMTEEC